MRITDGIKENSEFLAGYVTAQFEDFKKNTRKGTAYDVVLFGWEPVVGVGESQ